MAEKRIGEVIAVCTSQERGVSKNRVAEVEVVAGKGIRGDAHAGHPTRHVSLLADESANVMRRRGIAVVPGTLGENVVTRDIVLKDLPIDTILRIGKDVSLAVASVGKEHQEPNAIMAAVGDSIMLTEGLFCRALAGGKIRAGDRIEVVGYPAEAPTRFRTAVIVLSDSRSAGRREDAVIPACREALQDTPFEVAETQVLPDDEAQITAALRALVSRGDLALILTSGGTGLAPRDRTPEATRAVIEREAPGLAELLRWKGLEKTPLAVLSRGIAGAAGRSLVVNLPGSPQAVREGLETLLPILPHALETLLGQASECAGRVSAASRAEGK